LGTAASCFFKPSDQPAMMGPCCRFLLYESRKWLQAFHKSIQDDCKAWLCASLSFCIWFLASFENPRPILSPSTASRGVVSSRLNNAGLRLSVFEEATAESSQSCPRQLWPRPMK
jgi:hypothetical protein